MMTGINRYHYVKLLLALPTSNQHHLNTPNSFPICIRFHPFRLAFKVNSWVGTRIEQG